MDGEAEDEKLKRAGFRVKHTAKIKCTNGSQSDGATVEMRLRTRLYLYVIVDGMKFVRRVLLYRSRGFCQHRGRNG